MQHNKPQCQLSCIQNGSFLHHPDLEQSGKLHNKFILLRSYCVVRISFEPALNNASGFLK